MGIIFFDGDCGFCNRWVRFYLKYERDFLMKGSRPSFAPLQGTTAKLRIPNETDMSSVIYLSAGHVYRKSTAVLKIMRNMKLPFRILATCGWLVPRCVRDYVYDCIAKNRHQLADDYCHVPSKDEKTRFLS